MVSPGDLDTTIAAILENWKTQMSRTYMAMLSTKIWFYYRFQKGAQDRSLCTCSNECYSYTNN